MIAGLQKALEDHIQTFGDVFGEDHILAVAAVEQTSEHLPGFEDDLLHIVGTVIAAPVDVAALAGHIVIDRLRHSFRLWEGGAGVVQITFLHFRILDSSFLYIITYIYSYFKSNPHFY